MAEMTLKNLLAIEQSGWDALCRSEGGAFYGQIMTPDALMILPNGMVMNRADVVSSLAAAPPWASYSLTDVRAVRTGQDSVALVYQARASRDEEVVPFVALMASVYLLVEDDVRLALHQQTTITH